MNKEIFSKKEKQLRLENHEFKSRLAESEELLYAIQNGGVDAIVVKGSGGDSIYSLSSSETPYRVFIEEMSEGAAMVNAQGRIVFCNKRFSTLFSLLPEKAIGINFTQISDGHSKLKLEELLDLAKQGRIKEEIKFSFQHAEDLYMQFSFFPLELGEATNICIIVSDVTEKKVAAEKVLEINQRFELGIESAKMAWWEMDVKTGNILFHNRKAEMLGFPPENFKHYTDFMALVHPDDSEKLMDSMRNHMYGGADKYEGEYRMLNNKGEYIWFSDIGRVTKKDQNGASLKVNGIVLDITKSKNSEIVLKETSRRLELSLLSSKAGTWEWDMGSGNLVWSPQMFKLFGLDPMKNSASFDNWRAILHPEDIELAENRIGQALKDHTFLNSDYRLIWPNGEIRWINASGEGVYDEKDNPVQMIGLCIDITERKQAELSLIESEEHYRSLFENMINGVAYCQMLFEEGKPCDFVYLKVNEAFKSLTGLRNTTGKKVTEVIPGIRESDNKLFEIYGRVALTGIHESFEMFVESLNDWYFISVYSPKREYFVAIFEVITKRKLAEENLAYQALLLENINDAVIASDQHYRITKWNKAAELIYGWKAEDVLGKAGLNIIQTEFPEVDAELMRHNIVAQGQWIGEATQMRKDGSRFPVEISSLVIRDNEGQISGYVTVNRDITDRKKSETALIESERLLRESQSVASIGSYSLDLTTGLWKSSEILDEIFGIGENFNRTLDGWTSIVHPDWRDKLFNFLENEISKAQREFSQEYQIIRQNDRNVRWVHGIAGMEFDKYNQPTRITGTISDITERMLVQEKINYLAAIVQSSNDAIIGKDLNGTIISWNSGAAELFGYLENEILGESIKKIIPHDHLGEEIQILNKIKNGENLQNFETVRVTKTGQLIMVSVTASPIMDALGQIVGVSKVVRDITERKNLMEKLEVQNTALNLRNNELKIARDKAQESDRLKSAFLANISHEIRTPMNGILGFAELLKTSDLTSGQQHEYIDIIKKSGDRMLNIINDIVDISKIEAGLMLLNITETDIHLQIEFTYSFLKLQAESKGIQFLYNNGLKSKEFIVKTDSEKLYAILINLVKNAIKYTDKGLIEFGYTLKPASMSSGSDVAKKELEFYVKDTGIGIPLGRQTAIFDRFIQADISDTRAFQGAGLGLSISRSYVEMLGGKLWVVSEVGMGSAFYFTIPYNPEIKSSTVNVSPVQLDENPVKNLKILIVDDDETSLKLLSLILKKYAKEILSAQSGSEAVAICRANTGIDLVLMDIKMPGMDGYEATRLIRNFNKDVVIIAQTAFALPDECAKAIDSGCNDHISKPLNVAVLKALLVKYFSN